MELLNTKSIIYYCQATECPDFGICMGDHRMDHCKHCGEHYYGGNYGFPCQSCGNGKPRSAFVWNGKPDNAREVMDAILAEKGGQDTVILRAIIAGDPDGALVSLGTATGSFSRSACL